MNEKQKEIPVRYCPMCGRDLKEVENDTEV